MLCTSVIYTAEGRLIELVDYYYMEIGNSKPCLFPTPTVGFEAGKNHQCRRFSSNKLTTSAALKPPYLRENAIY